MGFSNGSPIKGGPQNVLLGHSRNVHIVPPANVQIKRRGNVRIGRKSNVRTFSELPMGTFEAFHWEVLCTFDTVRRMPLQIQPNINLLRTYFLDIHKMSRVRPNVGWVNGHT